MGAPPTPTTPDLKTTQRTPPIRSGSQPSPAPRNTDALVSDVTTLLTRRYGRSVRGRNTHCLFPQNHQHGDRRPSLAINKTGTRAKCLARDCLHGWQDVIGILRAVESLSFREAKSLCQHPEQLYTLVHLTTPTFTTPSVYVKQTVLRRFAWTTRTGQPVWHLRWDPGDIHKFSWAWDPDGRQLCDKARPCPPLTLYRSERFTNATVIHICEGERDADTVITMAEHLARPWITATCTPNGAKDIQPHYLTDLPLHCHLLVSGDRDPAGERYMTLWQELGAQAGRRLHRYPVLPMPGCNDWTDWYDEGGHPLTWFVELMTVLTGPASLLPPAHGDPESPATPPADSVTTAITPSTAN